MTVSSPFKVSPKQLVYSFAFNGATGYSCKKWLNTEPNNYDQWNCDKGYISQRPSNQINNINEENTMVDQSNDVSVEELKFAQ